MRIFLAFILLPSFVVSEDKLIHVHAVWRHGERNPARILPGDLNDISAFPDGFGQLTQNGINQLFTLGRHFKSRYIEKLSFLSKNFKTSEIYARSTDADRAIVSAMAFYSGLFSNDSSPKIQTFAPVPIHSIPSTDDFLNLLAFECQRKDILWRIVDQSHVIQALLNRSSLMLDEVANKTKLEADFYKTMLVYDAAIFETILGLPIPPWLTPLMPDFEALFVNYIATLWGFVPFPNDALQFDLQLELAKISSGSLIAEIVDRLLLKIKCQRILNAVNECSILTEQKLFTYSAHDITEISLLLGLGFENFTFEGSSVPSVGSCIVLELWEADEARNVASPKTIAGDEFYFVKVLYYQNSSVVVPTNIGKSLSECKSKGCPLSYLTTRAELLRPKPDLRGYCSMPPHSNAPKQSYSFVILIFSTIVYYFTK